LVQFRSPKLPNAQHGLHQATVTSLDMPQFLVPLLWPQKKTGVLRSHAIEVPQKMKREVRSRGSFDAFFFNHFEQVMYL